MMNFALIAVALLAPLAVWGLILRSMAAVAVSSKSGRVDPVAGWRFRDADIECLSSDEELEEAHAQSRYVNALYEDNFNYHRAA